MHEADIRPADLLAEYLRLSAEDAARFFPDAARLVDRACPGCGEEANEPAFVKNGFSLVRCRTCATLYVKAVPSDEALSAFYRDSPSQTYWNTVFFPAVAEARRGAIFQPRVDRLKELAARYGIDPVRVVDVGAGLGLFLEEARALGLGHEHWAVEPACDAAIQLRAKGFQTVEGFAADAAASGLGGSADLVASFEVIEHLIDPLAFLMDLGRLVRPGGLVVLSGLCGTGFDIMTLGEHSKAVSPPHHLTFLSRTGAETMVAKAGLELLSFLTPGKLDVDIVRNTLAQDDGAVTDPFLRQLLRGPAAIPEAFQGFLADNGLSSHMWLLARRPERP